MSRELAPGGVPAGLPHAACWAPGSDARGAGTARPACYDYLATRPSGMPRYQERLKAAAVGREALQHTLNCD